MLGWWFDVLLLWLAPVCLVLIVEGHAVSMYESSFTGFVVLIFDGLFQLELYCCCLLRCRCPMGLSLYSEHSVSRLSCVKYVAERSTNTR